MNTSRASARQSSVHGPDPVATAQHLSAISLSDVGKSFRMTQGRVEVALDAINLEVYSGEFLVLLGPSGCGKSTLLRIVAGLYEPSTGVVQRRDPDLLTQVGFAFQDSNLMPWRNAQQNVELPLELMGIAKKQRRARAAALLNDVGLANYADAYPHQLSGGMKQRVAIARTIAKDPALLLMDEPFGALDAQTREHMNLDLQTLWMMSRTTTIFVTHSISEAVFLADRVVVMSARPGRISDIIPVDFARPRGVGLYADPEFVELTRILRERLDEG